LARASQSKDEERAFPKGTTADLAGGFRLAYSGGWWKKAFVRGIIRRYWRSKRWVGSKLPHFMQAIDNELPTINHRDNASQIAIHHPSKKRFGPLQPAADAPP
jgi:hypothetical protein